MGYGALKGLIPTVIVCLLFAGGYVIPALILLVIMCFVY